jgi:class 3 adenylate cyclase/Flp pilus assembly protein TadD
MFGRGLNHKIRMREIARLGPLLALVCAVFFAHSESQNDSLLRVWQNKQYADSTRTQALYEFVWNNHLFAQADSTRYYAEKLKEFSHQNKYPKAKAKAFQLLAITAHMQGDIPDALSYFEQSLAIETQLGDTQNMASTLNNLGLLYKGEGKYVLALYKYQNSYDLLKRADDKVGMANALNNIGVIYAMQGNPTKALQYYEESLQLVKLAKDDKGIANALNNLGLLYVDLKLYEKAISTHQQSLEIRKKTNDIQGEATSLNNIAACYKELENTTLALEFYQKSMQLLEVVGDKQGQASVLNNLGVIYQQMEKGDSALKCYNRSIALKQVLGDRAGICNTQNNMGDFYLNLSLWNKAQSFCKSALEIARELKLLPEQEKACNCLYEAYKVTGNYNQSLHYLEQKSALTDSIKLEQTAKALQQLEFEKEVLADSISRAEEKRIAFQSIQDEKNKRTRNRNIFIVIGLFLIGGAVALWNQLRITRKSEQEISKERDKSDQLLLNILPQEIAVELKENGKAQPKKYSQATILFTDFKGFTQASSAMDATHLVGELNECFAAFDRICKTYNLEKIKTIGDAYMAVSGLPHVYKNATKNAVIAALEMAKFIEERRLRAEQKGNTSFAMRVGLHTGEVVAGIVGESKFQYDIWGDAVNTASRMESNSEVGRVNISETTYSLLKNDADFNFTYRGEIDAKGKGKMAMYFVQNS